MSNLRRLPLFIVLAVALIVVGVLSSTTKSVDPSQLPSALALNGSAESTALYCTGFTSTKIGASGPRDLLEHHRSVARGHDRRRLEPRTVRVHAT